MLGFCTSQSLTSEFFIVHFGGWLKFNPTSSAIPIFRMIFIDFINSYIDEIYKYHMLS